MNYLQRYWECIRWDCTSKALKHGFLAKVCAVMYSFWLLVIAILGICEALVELIAWPISKPIMWAILAYREKEKLKTLRDIRNRALKSPTCHEFEVEANSVTDVRPTPGPLPMPDKPDWYFLSAELAALTRQLDDARKALEEEKVRLDWLSSQEEVTCRNSFTNLGSFLLDASGDEISNFAVNHPTLREAIDAARADLKGEG